EVSINAEQNLAQSSGTTTPITGGRSFYCGTTGTSNSTLCSTGQYAYIGSPGWSPEAMVDGQTGTGTGSGNWPYTSYGFSSDVAHTGCSTQTCERWVTIDLGQPGVLGGSSYYNVDRVDLYPRSDNPYF